MITRLKWGRPILPKTMFKSKYILNSSFRPRVIDIPDEHVSVNDLSDIIMDYSKFGGLSDGDAVRVVLLFILCRVFFSKELKDMVCREWFILADDFEAWNSFPWGTFLFNHVYDILQTMFGKLKNIIKSGVTSKIKYTVLGFTLPFKNTLVVTRAMWRKMFIIKCKVKPYNLIMSIPSGPDSISTLRLTQRPRSSASYFCNYR
ncbi:hypothetical protein LXL04_017197 [Taraxacum kok-saghyz]